MTVHIMLDLETWGTEPGCDIRSIGACVFDPLTGYAVSPDQAHIGDEPWFYIATDNPVVMREHYDENGVRSDWDGVDAYRKYPLTRDPSTVEWWNGQTDEARAAFADPVDLREALGRFGGWLMSLTDQLYDRYGIVRCEPSPEIRLWSHGSHFDGPILAAAYRAVGLPVPWHYRAPRDTRTAFDLAGIEDHSAWLNQHPGPLAIQHHALDDAICQARAVCAAYGVIREWANAQLATTAPSVDDAGPR